MRLRGIVMKASLEENPPGSDRVEMILLLQGVGRDQPRRIVIPYEVLLGNVSIDVDVVDGHGFQADVECDEAGRWVVEEISLAPGRVLRSDLE